MNQPAVFNIRLWPRDLGVALVVLAALGLAWLLRAQTVSHSQVYQDSLSPFRVSYPATWISTESLQDLVLKVEDPNSAALFKPTFQVELRELDPQSPPTLQTLIDRRIDQLGGLTAYHFLSEGPATVANLQAHRLEYAYVVQPLDAPRRQALPVVVQAREYLVVTPERAYYLTLASAAPEFERAAQEFERILQTVVLQ